MKETIAWDDLHFHENGERVQADATLNLGLEGNWYALDLTGEHGLEIVEFLRRYIKVAERRTTPPKGRDISALLDGPGPSPGPGPVAPPPERQALPSPASSPVPPVIANTRRGKTAPPTEVPVTNGVPRPHAVGVHPEDYWEGFRTWCVHVKGVTLKRNGKSGKKQWYYPGHLIREYEEHLTALDKAQALQQLPLTG